MALYSLYIPISFNLVVLTNKNNFLTIILYNNNVCVTLSNHKDTLRVDLETYSIIFFKQKKIIEKQLRLKYNFNEANKYLKTFEIYFFIKIKFKGKGFKIKFNKKLKLIKFYFGRSHMTFYKVRRIKLKKVTKYKFMLKSFNLATLKKKASNITYVKPVNLYTLRGIRVSKQAIKKRKGKKSSYM